MSYRAVVYLKRLKGGAAIRVVKFDAMDEGDGYFIEHYTNHPMSLGWSFYETHPTLAAAKRAVDQQAQVFFHRNPDNWLQEADAEIEAHGTEGAFTRQARRAGYTDTLDFARQVKEDYERWVRLGKDGRAPYTLKTYRRATFAINAQKRRRRS